MSKIQINITREENYSIDADNVSKEIAQGLRIINDKLCGVWFSGFSPCNLTEREYALAYNAYLWISENSDEFPQSVVVSIKSLKIDNKELR